MLKKKKKKLPCLVLA